MKKVLSILPKEENKNFIFFFVFVVIIIFLESLSIGAVFPLLMTSFKCFIIILICIYLLMELDLPRIRN